MNEHQPQNIFTLLLANADRHPELAAIVEQQGQKTDTTTYRDLCLISSSLAEELCKKGIDSGSRVLVMIPMSRQLYAVLLALFKLKAVAMFVDPSADRSHIENCCRLYPPDAIVGTAKSMFFLPLLFEEIRRCPLKFVVDCWLPGITSLWTNSNQASNRQAKYAPGQTPDDAPEMQAADLGSQADKESDGSAAALLTFTSGSTGLPKAIIRTHNFLHCQYKVLSDVLQLKPEQRHLTSLPIFVLANLAAGATTIIPDCDLRHPAAARVEGVIDQIRRLAPQFIVGSPAFLESLARASVESSIKLTSIKQIYTGGGPVFPGIFSKIAQCAPEAKITAVYGSTEAEPIAEIGAEAISDLDWQRMRSGAGLLVGKPNEHIKVAIVSASEKAITDPAFLPPGQVGEIVVTGSHVVKSYAGGIGNAESKINIDGCIWHRTGDSGYFDSTGRLWLAGRIAGRIRDERGTLFPLTVETQVMQSKVVRRCALVAKKGKRILYLELNKNNHDFSRSAAEESDRCQLDSLLRTLPIDQVRALRRIPVDKRHNSKIDYGELNRLA